MERNYTLTSERADIAYNRVGQLLGYSEESGDSRTPDLKTLKNVTGITYDSLGSLAGQVESSQQIGRTETALPENLATLDAALLEGTTISSGGTDWEWADFSADEKKNLLNGESVTKKAALGDVVVTLSDGHATFVTKMDVTTITTRSGAETDARGRLVGFWETVNSTGKNLNRSETRHRENLLYDLQGRVVSYKDTVTATDAPSLTTVVNRTGMVYDPLGQLTGYLETSVQSEGGMDLKTLHSRRRGMLYDPRGRLLAYDETQTGAAGGRTESSTAAHGLRCGKSSDRLPGNAGGPGWT